MKYKVHEALIQHPCQDLPDNFQSTYIQQCLVTLRGGGGIRKSHLFLYKLVLKRNMEYFRRAQLGLLSTTSHG